MDDEISNKALIEARGVSLRLVSTESPSPLLPLYHLAHIFSEQPWATRLKVIFHEPMLLPRQDQCRLGNLVGKTLVTLEHEYYALIRLSTYLKGQKTVPRAKPDKSSRLAGVHVIESVSGDQPLLRWTN